MMKEQNGFTLLEVIIALCIFSIGLLAVASMQMSAIKGNHFSGTLTEATNWAADQMETLMSLPYDADPDLVAGDHTSPQEDIYTIAWNVLDDATTNNTKTITITVAWTDRGSQRTITLRGIKAR